LRNFAESEFDCGLKEQDGIQISFNIMQTPYEMTSDEWMIHFYDSYTCSQVSPNFSYYFRGNISLNYNGSDRDESVPPEWHRDIFRDTFYYF
jgi:hypothetical protein